MDSYKKVEEKHHSLDHCFCSCYRCSNCIIYTFYIHGAELIQREI